MQPYLLPYLGYFQLIHAVDTFVLLDDVNFIKRGWINRNTLLTHNGPMQFNLPLNKVSQNRTINQHHLHNGDGVVKLTKVIQQSYKKAPFYTQLQPILNELTQYKDDKLVPLIQQTLEQVSNQLSLNCQFLLSSQLTGLQGLKGQQRILAICQKLNASHYINPIGAKDIGLYQAESFNQVGIKFNYIKGDLPEYTQFNNKGFVANLSIVDALANVELTELNRHCSQYQLI